MFQLASSFGNGLCFPLEPAARVFIAVEEVVGLLPDLRMIVVHPFELSITEKRRFNQIATNRGHCDMFEAQPRFVAKLVRGLHLTCHNNI